ncbi:hypothetical protein [Pseudocitrobacter cyperus]|uniref:Uncharacterized protein n=1 Tax=Pseudocitrobacter cyperus TaxID=3112843 RepID=A0ABV0HIU3_9ENTR
MMDYYLGGYLLLRCLPVNHLHPQLDGKPLLTCSTCFNESLLNAWSYGWGIDVKDTLYDASTTLFDHLESAFGLDDIARENIRIWVNEKFDQELIGWCGVFMSAATAIEYKKQFFQHAQNCYLFGLYFNDSDARRFIAHWQPKSERDGLLGIPQKLMLRQPENDDINEQFLGYDIVGLDIGGEFHTSHCHGLHNDLHRRFGLTLNEHGLYNNVPDWQPVVDYMNDEATGSEPVPWGIAKIKQVIF